MIPAAAIRARGRPGDGARRVTSPSYRVGVVQVRHVVPEHGAAADRAGRAVDEDGEEVLADLLVRFPAGGVPGHAFTVRLAPLSSASRASQPDGLGGRPGPDQPAGRLLMFPIVLGAGARLFPDGTPPIDLNLVSAQTAGPAVRLIYARP
jgi:hypothetical protein